MCMFTAITAETTAVPIPFAYRARPAYPSWVLQKFCVVFFHDCDLFKRQTSDTTCVGHLHVRIACRGNISNYSMYLVDNTSYVTDDIFLTIPAAKVVKIFYPPKLLTFFLNPNGRYLSATTPSPYHPLDV